MRNRITMLLGFFLGLQAVASQPGDKRTILTAGEAVQTIRYQLGQSTVLYLGLRPETVICGNKNYFNIEKIKEGVTIQALANFSTNLTILDHGRRYLFYLTPSGAKTPDTFVDVKWISQADIFPIEKLPSSKLMQVFEINQSVAIARNVELTILRQKWTDGSKRRIFELELKNKSPGSFLSQNIAVLAMNGRRAFSKQATVWEGDEALAKQILRGRLIVERTLYKGVDFVVRFKERDTRVTVKGGFH